MKVRGKLLGLADTLPHCRHAASPLYHHRAYARWPLLRRKCGRDGYPHVPAFETLWQVESAGPQVDPRLVGSSNKKSHELRDAKQ